MTTAADQFHTELIVEHLEEASFLYEQRLALLHDQELGWHDLEAFEDRHQAHIAALAVGDNLALEICLKYGIEGDAGDLHAATTVFCQTNLMELLQKVIEDTDLGDEDRVLALSDALVVVCPQTWLPDLIELAEENTALVPAILRLVGWRRFTEFASSLLKWTSQEEHACTFAWSLGRLGLKASVSLLNNLFKEGDPPRLSFEVALALLRLKDHLLIGRLVEKTPIPAWAMLPIGLGGTRAEARLLIQVARTSTFTSSDGLLALGLLGDSSAMGLLLDYLQEKQAAEVAAQALNLLTGAELFEQVFVADEIDEDELFEDEIESVRKGEPHTKADGTPYGSTITRLSQDPITWRDWWEGNRGRFQEGVRFRNGKPYSPACLIENLKSETCPNRIRDLAHHELLIRYGADIPFELEMRVPDQKKAIARYEDWLVENRPKFQEGHWYFHGEPM